MFTGIITDVGIIHSRSHSGGDLRLRIDTQFDAAGIKLGESIACNGCCLTVVECGEASGASFFDVQLSQETLDCTAGGWAVGERLNLERALKMGDDISGHLVTGHIDGVAALATLEPSGGSHILTFKAPEALMPFIAPKGSVTLNGVSLTVNDVQGHQFTVNIIPHTWEHTNFINLTVGGAVNVEIDLLARYVVNALNRHPVAGHDPR